MTLNGYISFLQSIVEENKKLGELPVGYAEDDEGNGYQGVHNQPTPAQVENTEEYHWELVGYIGDDSIAEEDINCIIIN